MPAAANLLIMRRVLLSALMLLVALPLMAPAGRAATPIENVESGGTLFAGGGTNVSNGVFFPGTAIYDGSTYQGLPPLQIAQGTDLTFVNLDVGAVANGHQIISFRQKRGVPVFKSPRVDGPGQALVITSHVKPGVYPFFCTIHFGMYGRLEVVPQ